MNKKSTRLGAFLDGENFFGEILEKLLTIQYKIIII